MIATGESEGEYIGMGWLDNDDFVPEYMCEQLYESANLQKR